MKTKQLYKQAQY